MALGIKKKVKSETINWKYDYECQNKKMALNAKLKIKTLNILKKTPLNTKLKKQLWTLNDSKCQTKKMAKTIKKALIAKMKKRF